MSEFLELWQPGYRFLREQRDLEKVLVVVDDQGGRGPKPLDLESGRVVITLPDSVDTPSEQPG